MQIPVRLGGRLIFTGFSAFGKISQFESCQFQHSLSNWFMATQSAHCLDAGNHSAWKEFLSQKNDAKRDNRFHSLPTSVLLFRFLYFVFSILWCGLHSLRRSRGRWLDWNFQGIVFIRRSSNHLCDTYECTNYSKPAVIC